VSFDSGATWLHRSQVFIPKPGFNAGSPQVITGTPALPASPLAPRSRATPRDVFAAELSLPSHLCSADRVLLAVVNSCRRVHVRSEGNSNLGFTAAVCAVAAAGVAVWRFHSSVLWLAYYVRSPLEQPYLDYCSGGNANAESCWGLGLACELFSRPAPAAVVLAVSAEDHRRPWRRCRCRAACISGCRGVILGCRTRLVPELRVILYIKRLILVGAL
jgi:hypothetical protein